VMGRKFGFGTLQQIHEAVVELSTGASRSRQRESG
jgi:hypothetical protein